MYRRRARMVRLRLLLFISDLAVNFSARRLSLDMSHVVNMSLCLILFGMGVLLETWKRAMLIALTSFLIWRTLAELLGGVLRVEEKRRLATAMQHSKKACALSSSLSASLIDPSSLSSSSAYSAAFLRSNLM